jgi:predicted nucleic acid-binding OB-fold protein
MVLNLSVTVVDLEMCLIKEQLEIKKHKPQKLENIFLLTSIAFSHLIDFANNPLNNLIRKLFLHEMTFFVIHM